MSAAPQNLLFILSDEHNPKLLGAAGHSFIQTPNLDALAARGTRFTSAYTPCPICVPARASLATGQNIAAMGKFFDNADPYDGSVPSWHHALRDAGHRVVSIGKLHFRGLPGDDHGFSEEKLAMHVVDGTGDLLGLIRGPDAPERKGAAKMARSAGPGESDYTRYDRDIAAQAQIWLREVAPGEQKPWCLFVSLVTPHFPLIAPPEFFYRYFRDDLLRPKRYAPEEWLDHPAIRDYMTTNAYQKHVRDDGDLKRMLAGYCGMVSFMDEQVGKILTCLEDAGLGTSTRVLYSSDHGDNLGARGMWGKSNMFEESAGVPMILAGEGVPEGRVVTTPVSLTDVFATVLDGTGAPASVPAGSRSLLALAAGVEETERPVLSEYHATGSREASFMVRQGRWKYMRWITYPPMLFDLDADPEELHDLGASPAHADVRARLEATLRDLLGGRDPAALDAAAKARQRATLQAHGGAAAALARGELPYSPPPGVKPAWS